MDDKTPMLQFKQGLETIHQALLTAINQREIPLFHIAYTVEGPACDRTMRYYSCDQRPQNRIADVHREEISDSAHRIDSFADAKVRVLVSRCSGGRE